MGFKDMMKSFLYENVEDDDQDLEEEEEEVEVSAPQADKHSFLRKKQTAQPASQTPSPEAVQTAAPAAAPVYPAPQSAPAAASQSGQTPSASANPYAAAPAYTPEYTNPALYTEPKISAGVPAADSGNFLSRIDDVIEQPQPEKKVSRVRRPTPASRDKNRLARQDYSSVISPIFGNVSEEEKDISMLHDAINLPKPVDTLEMIEIISPMFGARNVQANAKKKVTPVTAQKAAQPAKRKKAAPGQDHQKTEHSSQSLGLEDDNLPAVEPEMEPATTSTPTDLGSFLSRKPARKNGSSKGSNE